MNKLVSSLLVFALYCSSVAPLVSVAYGQADRKAMNEKYDDAPEGLKFHLSEVVSGVGDRRKPEPSAYEQLNPEAAQNILRRLPDIKAKITDQSDFAQRAASLPAPKNGRRLPVSFPSTEQRGTPKLSPASALNIVRFSPEGEISLAPDLSVTFSQPMVSITSQARASEYAPVELKPQVDGRWRWLGTNTLIFDTKTRFPMATRFAVRVPAGTRSANGQTLATDVAWNFTTPPPKVEQVFPQNQVAKRDSLIFISFDQDINPEAVVRSIDVSAGGKKVRIRLASEGEIAADESINSRARLAGPKRWLALRAVNPDGSTVNALPSSSTVVVTVQQGTPSAEGPLVTEKSQIFRFTTYGPLKYVRSFCGWEQNPNCSPFETWMIEFNNPIEIASFVKEFIKIEPEIEGVTIAPSGRYLYISGYKKGRTTYKITIDGSIKDSFGQALGRPATAAIKVGSAPLNLYAQGGFMSVLDPTAKPTYSIFSTNQPSIKVKMYKVQPEDWSAYQDYVRHLNYDDGKRPSIPGKIVFDRDLRIANKPDEMVETRLDVSRALDDGFGNVIVEVEPTSKRDQYDRSRIVTWLQATQIGLDAFVDSTELVGFASDLRTGRSAPGVELSIYPNGSSTPLSTIDEPKGPGVGLISRAWNWLSGWGSSQANGTLLLQADGSQPITETVEPARSNRTGTNGMLRLALPAMRSETSQNILIARRGRDAAFLPENSEYYWQQEGTWYKKPQPDSLRWFVFDDRKMYRPNEEVSVKGYIRKLKGGKLGDIEGLADAATTLSFSVKDPRNNEIATGTTTINAFGAFDLKFKLPDNANLGGARIDLSTTSSLSGNVYVHNFQIQEFRRPEFEVTTKVVSEAPFLVGESANVSVDAKYYSGGGLANADAKWTVTATPTNYTPPNRGDFTFGTWVPWWGIHDRGGFGFGYGSYPGMTQSLEGVTDAEGTHVLKIDFESVRPARPYSIQASASVQDVNRQTWSSSSSLLVHPSSLYTGIKTPRTFVQKGEKMIVETIASDLDGNLVVGRNIDMRAVLKDWTFDRGAWKEETVDEQTCSVKSADFAKNCEFIAKQGGRYTITASVMDDRERLNQSELTIWVPGGKTPPKRNVEQESIQIIPSKKDFAAGETAELLVLSPFFPAEGVLTLRREGIVRTERFSMSTSSVTLKVPIQDMYLPNIHAQVDLVGSVPRTKDNGEVDLKLSNRPAFASGNINLPVSTESRRLSVFAEPADKTLVPGGNTTVDVLVKDSAGEPVSNSEIAVVIVDESVLALSAYRMADPVGIFYSPRADGVQNYHSRADVQLGNPADVHVPPPPPPGVSNGISVGSAAALPRGAFSSKLQVSGFQIDGASGSENAFTIDGQEVAGFRTGMLNENGVPIKQRANFDALAVFAPSAKTDSNGRASIEVKLPDNLTRYRITAVAADRDKRFGLGESAITARQPLMVRPSAPRFMNFGDKIELPVVVQNQTDVDMAVDVVVRATNATMAGVAAEAGSNSDGKRVLVKANDRAEIRFPVAALKAGVARFQIAATSGKHSDAADISLPVWTPATSESFATYGTTDDNGVVIQPVEAPSDVFTQFGGLEVTTSSTQLQELTDAFIYLTNYPYACSEQIASRMISIAAMRDVLDAFKSKDMPTKAQLDAYFSRDINILKSRQRDDGSFGLWKRDRERYEYPFLTVHAAHAMALAKAKGYGVPDEMVARTKPFLRNVEKHFDAEWYKNSPQVRWTISAYALYVRDIMGDKDVEKARRLLTEATIEKMPFEALGWVLSVLADDPGSQAEKEAIVRFLLNRTAETAATANFVTDYGDGAWLIMYSNRRADGVLLEALIKLDPKNDLIPKLVRGLLDNRIKGAWSNTQENVFILLALDKYFNAFEKVTPDFVTRVWLGNTYAGEQTFKGRSVDSNVLNIPMNYLVEKGGVSNLLIDRQGAGRLYYRLGMKYAPINLRLEPVDYGFTVLRQYEAVEDPADVRHNDDGSWTIRSGALVRVRLSMVAQARRYHVALVDQLPAGLEILNPELAVTQVAPPDKGPSKPVVEYGSRAFGGGGWYSRQHWFEHQNFRDERAEAFAALLWEGVYDYAYVARATTPGRFVVPPARAEEMYHPETFGHTGTDFVNVE